MPIDLADILSNGFPIRVCHFGSPVLPGPSERAEQTLRESEECFRSLQMDPAGVGDGLAAMGALWDADSAGQPYPPVLLDARMPAR